MEYKYRKAKASDALANITERIKIRNSAYLSWWIANLGVVPLILFADFLFEPAFLALFSLFTLVTHVFETILSLLYRAYFLIKTHNSLRYLRINAPNVKTILAFVLISPALCYSSPQNHTNKQNIIISVGEHREISCPKLKSYTVTNKVPISHRDNRKMGHLLVRGKKSGHTQLITWDNSGVKQTYNISVLPRGATQKTLTLVKAIHELNLSARTNGNQVIVEGTINNILTIKALQLLSKKNKDIFIFGTQYSLSLSNKIREVIYGAFLKKGINSVTCKIRGITPLCHYDNSNLNIGPIIKALSTDLDIDFIPFDNPSRSDNYTLKLKLVQLERVDGMELNFGLSQLSGGVDAIFNHGPMSLIEANQLLLRERKINISTLAEPTVKLRQGKKATIEVGGDYPYQSINSVTGRQNTSWRFAGLKVELTLNFENEKTVITYSTNFTTPGPESSIIGNKEKGDLKIELDTPIELFKVMLKTKSGMRGQIPLLGSIPFVGHLFSSINNSENYKQIIAVMELSRDE